jgi:hypothetical protein
MPMEARNAARTSTPRPAVTESDQSYTLNESRRQSVHVSVVVPTSRMPGAEMAEVSMISPDLPGISMNSMGKSCCKSKG